MDNGLSEGGAADDKTPTSSAAFGDAVTDEDTTDSSSSDDATARGDLQYDVTSAGDTASGQDLTGDEACAGDEIAATVSGEALDTLAVMSDNVSAATEQGELHSSDTVTDVGSGEDCADAVTGVVVDKVMDGERALGVVNPMNDDPADGTLTALSDTLSKEQARELRSDGPLQRDSGSALAPRLGVENPDASEASSRSTLTRLSDSSESESRSRNGFSASPCSGGILSSAIAVVAPARPLSSSATRSTWLLNLAKSSGDWPFWLRADDSAPCSKRRRTTWKMIREQTDVEVHRERQTETVLRFGQ